MNRFYMAIIGAALACAAVTANAQVRVRGDITAVDGNVLSVRTREGRDVKVELTKDAAVSYPTQINFADIQAGTPLATTAIKRDDGKLVAREVRAFPKERGVSNPGHRPIDTEPNATMTNAVVALVQAGSGRELILTYKGGSQTVVVPENTPVVLMHEGDRSLLVPGAYVYISSAKMDNDGKLTATGVNVSKDGVRPPQ